MRGDDFLGSLVARKLIPLFNKKDDVTVFDGGVVPENYTGAVKKENPSHIILIDAADMGESPGFIRIVEKEEVSKYHLSTHAMPISFLIKYLEHSTGAKVILIGIQPKDLELADHISEEITESINHVVYMIHKHYFAD